MTPSQQKVYNQVKRHKKGIYPTLLAKKMKLTRSTVSMHLDNLYAAGILELEYVKNKTIFHAS